MNKWLRLSVAVVLLLFGLVFLLETMSVVFKFKSNLTGSAGVYFGAEFHLFLGVAFLLGAAAMYRSLRRERQR